MTESWVIPPDARVELINGIIYDKAPQSSLHSTAVRAAQEILRTVFASGYDVRGQLPLYLAEDSAPEPDIAVVKGSFKDYSFEPPTTAVLVAEVADESLRTDRKRKLPLYARVGIAESWILDVQRRRLEVYRDPEGKSYRSKTILRAGEAVVPLARPDSPIAVADLFPWG